MRLPPGLSGLEPSIIERPASTGAAIKPSARTIVDMIEQDFPNPPLNRCVGSPVHRKSPPSSPNHHWFESRASLRSPVSERSDEFSFGRSLESTAHCPVPPASSSPASPRFPRGHHLDFQYNAQALPTATQLQQEIIYGSPLKQREIQQEVSRRLPVIANGDQRYSYASVPVQQPPQQANVLSNQLVSLVPLQNQVYWQDMRVVAVQPMTHEPKPRSGRLDNKGNGRGRHKRRDKGNSFLDEFRLSKVSDRSLWQIKGHIVEFCQDQTGSRFVQQRLEMGNPAEQEVCTKEVLPAIHKLLNDVFGNFVVQKLLAFGSPSTKHAVLETLQGHLLRLSSQSYGCRVVQKAFEVLDEDHLPDMLQEFHHSVLSCIRDQHGNHVIQKCIEVVCNKSQQAIQNGDMERAKHLRQQIDFIIDDIMRNMRSISCHPYGCRVVQRLLEHCDQDKRLAVLDELQKSYAILLTDRFGNYVIQNVSQFGRCSDRDSILQIIVNTGLLGLAQQKFASNVIEKLLKYGNSFQQRAIVREMIKVSAYS